MYYFSRAKRDLDALIEKTSSGGVLVNDTITHFINHSMPFGGVGESGMGAYHGKYGFETFSHYKACDDQTDIFRCPDALSAFRK